MNNFFILLVSKRNKGCVTHSTSFNREKAFQNSDGLAVPGSSSVSWAKPHHHYASRVFSKIIRTPRNHQTLMRKQMHTREKNSDILRPNLPRAPTNAVSTYQKKTICGIWKTNNHSEVFNMLAAKKSSKSQKYARCEGLQLCQSWFSTWKLAGLQKHTQLTVQFKCQLRQDIKQFTSN